MLKLFGAMLVIGSCFAFAQKAVKSSQKQLSALKELYTFLTDLSQEIAFRLEPIPQLLEKFGAEEKEVLPSFAQQLNTMIKQDKHRPLREIWQEALSQYAEKIKLPRKALNILYALGDHLGEADYETETARLQAGAESLLKLHQSLEQDNIKAEKLTRSLGVLLGIFIVILLL